MADAPTPETRLGELAFEQSDKPLGGLNPNSQHFKAIGNQFLQLLISHGLRANYRVLDIGCGTGRMAIPILNYLHTGKYVGLDINQRFIDYCRAHYTQPNATFDRLDVQHDEYNQNGTITPTEVVLPYLDQSFDCIIAIALFNHLRPAWVLHYLAESARVLRHGGLHFATAMLLQPQSIAFIGSGRTHPFKFEVREEHGWFDNAERPLTNAAIHELPIRRAYMANALLLKEPIKYGVWGGAIVATTGHDLLIATKQTKRGHTPQ